MKVLIKDFPDYYVEEDGSVWSHKHKTPKKLSTKPDKQGYARVSLSKDNKLTMKKVHRLVAQAFIPNPQSLPLVCHKVEGYPLDNSKTNLFWGTVQDNNRDMDLKARRARGEKQGLSKLTAQEVLSIRSSSDTMEVLSKRFGVTHSNIQAIIYRRTWKHI